jgi:transcription elongation factor Elf1
MAKNTVSSKSTCPQCGEQSEMIWDLELKASSNITVLNCHVCDWEFAKDQSVKIPGNLVRQAAVAMNIHEGYSSLGEYVRDCVRRMNEQMIQQQNAEQFATFMGAVGDNPEKFIELLSISMEDEV